MEFAKKGNFFTGCNYWASHAGTNMWSDWQPDVIEKDMRLLSEGGLKILRVFPLWPVFQPIKALRSGYGDVREFRAGEDLLKDDEAGKAGISMEAISCFKEFISIAEKYGFKLIVGLVTGWMSGRFYAPDALAHLNAITDPSSIKWQIRFVKFFVKYFNGEKSIVGWDLGNECNCMGKVSTRDEAWLWSSTIANAIRACDNIRPVISGMHSISPLGEWAIEDQGEITDLLTTHPYPLFTPGCNLDPLNSIRSILHATAESCYYRDIGNKPCFVEEIGSLSNMLASESTVAQYVRPNLFTLWAHDLRGFLWWCGFDQHFLTHAPYDWCSTEGELGLVRADKSAKPVFDILKEFSQFISTFPLKQLPERIRDAVCIISDGQEHWKIAYNSFILAKQAGIDIEFQYETQNIKEAQLYMLPSIKGLKVINKHVWMQLIEKVKAGAVLYISYEDGLLDRFEEVAGVRVEMRQYRYKNTFVKMEKLDGQPVLGMNSAVKLTLNPVNARVLGTEEDGNPVFTCAELGKGKVFFLSFPVEQELSNRAAGYHNSDSESYWKIYKHIASKISREKVVYNESPMIGVTEHPIDQNSRIIAAVNYSTTDSEAIFYTCSDWEPEEVYYGNCIKKEGQRLSAIIPANDALVFKLTKL